MPPPHRGRALSAAPPCDPRYRRRCRSIRECCHPLPIQARPDNENRDNGRRSGASAPPLQKEIALSPPRARALRVPSDRPDEWLQGIRSRESDLGFGPYIAARRANLPRLRLGHWLTIKAAPPRRRTFGNAPPELAATVPGQRGRWPFG